MTNPELLDEGTGPGPEDYSGNGASSQAADWNVIFGAPDFKDLVSPKQSQVAREYTTRVNSVLKAGLMGCLNVGDIPDAAAILHHGPAFARATGQLADSSETVQKVLDILTAPDSPILVFALAAIPFVGQIMRNHEHELKQVPTAMKQGRAERKAMKQARKNEPPRFTIRLLGKRIPIRLRFHFNPGKLLLPFKAQTLEPAALVSTTFSNPALIRALEKQGITLVRRDGTTQ